MAQLLVGAVADRLGAKPLLVIGYGLCAVAGLMFAAAQSADAIYLGRLVQGVGEAPVWALGPALLAQARPHAKCRVIGAYNAAIHAGLMGGPLLSLLVAPSGEGAAPFLAFAAMCFVGGAAIHLLAPAVAPAATASSGQPASARRFLRLMTVRRPMILLVGVLCYGGCYGVFVSVLPISLSVLNQFDARATNELFVVFYAAIGVAQWLAGPVSDRFGAGGATRGGMWLAAIGFAALVLAPGVWAYGPVAVARLGLGFFAVAALAELNDAAPDGLKGAVSGAFYFAWAIGYTLGPIAAVRLSAESPSFGYVCIAGALGAYAALLSVFGRAPGAEGRRAPSD